MLIFDESHFLKGYKSQRTKVALELSAEARRIILLSGTPALSRPIELYSQIQCLAVRGWPPVHDFALRYITIIITIIISVITNIELIIGKWFSVLLLIWKLTDIVTPVRPDLVGTFLEVLTLTN